ncbi:MAG: outer membrane lipoprotein carrier protein LolA [Phycisphaerae bacterium]|nr:outer membrane lipoprotein carrier protein LolA [Phycisphaerae bacterium]
MKKLLTTAILFTAALSPAQPPATAPALWQQMLAVDASADHIASVRANFRQEKFTPLMKKPLVSTGTIAAAGATSFWITDQPEPTKMLVTDREIRLYYPNQSAEEIYPIVGKLGSLASSPLPRLSVLREFFSFTQLPVGDLDPSGDDAHELALRLEPIDEQMKQHVAEVRVLLERSSGLVKLAETIDPDGEKTRLTFTNVQINLPLKSDDLKLDVPAGTSISHPLEGLGDASDGAAPIRATTTPAGDAR